MKIDRCEALFAKNRLSDQAIHAIKGGNTNSKNDGAGPPEVKKETRDGG